MANPFDGGGNLPADEQTYRRFDVVAGAVVPGAITPAPPVAVPRLVPADRLTTSPTARGADDTIEARRIYAPELAAGMAAALSGRRDNADQTKLTAAKLAVEGYVNPWDLVRMTGERPDVPLVSQRVKLVP